MKMQHDDIKNKTHFPRSLNLPDLMLIFKEKHPGGFKNILVGFKNCWPVRIFIYIDFPFLSM